MAATRARQHLNPLTGLRGTAAYVVLVGHAIDFAFYYGGVSIFHDFAARWNFFGMSLFFVLSGFVIWHNYADVFRRERLSVAAHKFFAARFARLYPLYAVGILISLPHIRAPVFYEFPWVAAAYLTLTQSWWNVQMAIFVPFWSVSTEAFFYLAFVPLVFLVAMVRHTLRAMAIYLLVTLAIVLIGFAFVAEPTKAGAIPWLYVDKKVSSSAWGWISYYNPYLRVLEFVAGMLAARVYATWSTRQVNLRWLLAIEATAVLWCALVLLTPLLSAVPLLANIERNFIFAPALAPLMVSLCLSDSRLSRLLSSRPMLLAGEISYSVYVWSFFVGGMLASSYVSLAWSAEAAINSTIKVFMAAGLTTVFAYGSYKVIEVPSRRFLRRVLGA